jgi:hypothetical protein|tara:strand:- start:5 stop:193 length:189 start_codon:yes stop_codon:yes gene_type:complete
MLRNPGEESGPALEYPRRVWVEEQSGEKPVVCKVTPELVDVISPVFGNGCDSYFDGIVQRCG